MNNSSEILSAIAGYSRAYSRLSDLQGDESLLPAGREKEDCIAEFYAHLYLLNVHPGASVTTGKHDHKGWTLQLSGSGDDTRILVEAISGYSVTRVLSPLHAGWNELFVVSLGRTFQPNGFWIVPAPKLDKAAYPLRGVIAPAPGAPGPAGSVLDFSRDAYAEFMRAIPFG